MCHDLLHSQNQKWNYIMSCFNISSYFLLAIAALHQPSGKTGLPKSTKLGSYDPSQTNGCSPLPKVVSHPAEGQGFNCPPLGLSEHWGKAVYRVIHNECVVNIVDLSLLILQYLFPTISRMQPLNFLSSFKTFVTSAASIISKWRFPFSVNLSSI